MPSSDRELKRLKTFARTSETKSERWLAHSLPLSRSSSSLACQRPDPEKSCDEFSERSLATSLIDLEISPRLPTPQLCRPSLTRRRRPCKAIVHVTLRVIPIETGLWITVLWCLGVF